MIIFICIMALLTTGCLINFPSDQDEQNPDPDNLVAFPSAEGFGAYTTGGRGGDVYIVTNLNDSGAGSLREGISKPNRIIVFEVSGIIELKSKLELSQPNITIAGQTSPQGITITDQPVNIMTDNIIMRHLRIRLGDRKKLEVDALEIRHPKKYVLNNIILDHITTSWGVDETLSISYADSVTVQWSIVSEALNEAGHVKGAHGYGSLFRGQEGEQVSVHHNLYAHNGGRNPRPGNYTSRKDDPVGYFFDFRNNVVYNWSDSEAGNNEDQDSITTYNFIGNYYKSGPQSNKNNNAFKDNALHVKSYWEGNAMNGSIPRDQYSIVSGKGPGTNTYTKSTVEFPFAYITTDSADAAYDSVLASAGAFPRDAIDDRVVKSVINKTGKIINSQNEVVSNWPQVQAVKSKVLTFGRTDSNRNGIADWWETENNVKNGDHNQVMRSGYTAIEEYVNWIADELIY